MSESAALVVPSAAQQLPLDTTPSIELPPFLRRPDERGHVARLSYKTRADDAQGNTEPRWGLQGSPEVVYMARKLFSGAISKRKGTCSFPAIEAHFEDLLMMQHRFPIEIGPSARDVWEEMYERTVEKWYAAHAQRPAGQPTLMKHFTGQLKEFQEIGVDFLMANRKTLLADDMGLGKTLQALAFADRLDDWPVVIVCQPHVVRHWERKIEEFLNAVPAGTLGEADRLSYLTLKGIKPQSGLPKADIYIVHYLVLRGWDMWLKGIGARTVIFDEAQEVRHTGTAKYKAAKNLTNGARNVAGLSGTPIYNHGIEIFNVMDILNRGCLGKKNDFSEQWCDAYSDSISEPAMLGQYLRDRGLMIRRRKDEVLDELPPKRRVVETIDVNNKLFAEMIQEAQSLASEAGGHKNPFDKARMEAEAINSARKTTGIAKAPAVAEFLRGLLEAEQPTLCFLHHHAPTDYILDRLDEFKPACITGRQSMAEKDESRSRFISGDTNLCIIGLRAATGIDGLQERARVVVFGELDWSPAIHRQAEDRAHRYGQQDEVLAYYLTADVGTDPVMMMALGVKDMQAVGILHDKLESEEEAEAAREAADEHKQMILRMLRGEG